MTLSVGDRVPAATFKVMTEDGLADKTVVFFWTDHGVSHLRGKQFLYEEGIRVPLIVRFPDGRDAGTVRRDLVSHIDVAATSLELAGIDISPNAIAVAGRKLVGAPCDLRIGDAEAELPCAFCYISSVSALRLYRSFGNLYRLSSSHSMGSRGPTICM